MSDTDCRVVDAEEKSIFALPAGGSLAFREPDEFEVVSLRVPVVKRPDACHRREIVWQGLRRGAYVPDVMSAQRGIGYIYIADDDGEVLKPQIVTAAVRRNGAASWRRSELSEL